LLGKIGREPKWSHHRRWPETSPANLSILPEIVGSDPRFSGENITKVPPEGGRGGGDEANAAGPVAVRGRTRRPEFRQFGRIPVVSGMFRAKNEISEKYPIFIQICPNFRGP